MHAASTDPYLAEVLWADAQDLRAVAALQLPLHNLQEGTNGGIADQLRLRRYHRRQLDTK